jgi:hypothetical protein
MNDNERKALQQLRFEWSPTQEEVWTGPEIHVAGLNQAIADGVLAAFSRAQRSPAANPLGIVLEGQPGVGKTHLLSWICQQVQRAGGYFFLLGVPQRNFWDCLVQAFLEGLTRPAHSHPDQLTKLLDGLCDQSMVNSSIRDEILGRKPLTKDGLEDFIDKFRYIDPNQGRRYHQTLRALVLLKAWDTSLQDLGEGYLRSTMEAIDADARHKWNLVSWAKTPREVVEEISHLLALTGPSVVAADQIDSTLAQVRRASARQHSLSSGEETTEVIQLMEEIGQGLMDAREKLRRTVLIISCLTTTWTLISENTLGSIKDRFRQEERLSRIPSAEVGHELVRAHFAAKFAAIGYEPPDPTWPVARSAFDDAPDYTPRALLQRVDAHVRECLRRGQVIPLTSLEHSLIPPSIKVSRPSGIVEPNRMKDFDEQYATFRKHASVAGVLDPDVEDRDMPGLLVAGLRAWVREKDEEDQKRFVVHAGSGSSSAMQVHAYIQEFFSDDPSDFGVCYFRGLASGHHAAVLPRLERLMRLAALDPQVPHRRAVLLRNIPWPNGPTCRAKRTSFETVGGLLKKISEDDLRTFYALGKMLEEDEPGFDLWLADRLPASRTGIFTEVFRSPPEFGPGPTGSDDGPPDPDRGPTQSKPGPDDHDPGPSGPDMSQRGTKAGTDAGPEDVSGPEPPAGRQEVKDQAIPLGTAAETGQSITLDLRDLRKHVAIFAGSGSGKTVLIRRLIEECALRGVSTIALDPNNDLARLGDPWPSPPASWTQKDKSRAVEYLHNTEVVVWTPRRESGRPLSLQPLPDFQAILGDPDEFELALDSAVAALAPRARVGGNTAKMDQGRAVLREALASYARSGGSQLSGLVDFLGDLPAGVTSLDKARDLAYEMAQTLTAAKINDPLFGGSGVPLDPGVLLTPSPGKRARVSLISLIGVPSDEQRQSFVNQLQMALFSWIKRHPANDRPLGGLFVMDEAQTFAPSGASTACTESTLALASQARKYGLGLIFATQAPRGIHNRIVGNAATHFYGYLNSPVQIAAAKEMAQGKGGAAIEVAQLRTGQFYSMGEGAAFQRISTPMCLSYHPSGPLTPEEVLERSRAEPKR